MTQENTATEAVFDPPIGITNPPIDELLGKASSKYALAIFAAKRARQINDYYQQIDEGMLEYVGPLVTPGVAEKPLSIALREINAGLLDHTEGSGLPAASLHIRPHTLFVASRNSVTMFASFPPSPH